MTTPGERISRFLTEFRMLITAVGVLLAFQLQVSFTSGFLELPFALRAAHLVGLLAAVLSFTALLIPAAYHRIASEVHNEETFLDYARRSVGVGFLGLGVSLVLSAMLYGARAFGRWWGLGVALVLVVTFVVGWWWLPRQISRVSDVRPSR